jgi:integration host factor subunit beta
MTKSDLIARLARRFIQLDPKSVGIAANAILSALTAGLVKGGRTEIRGFGSFEIYHRPPRIGRNPEPGEKVQVPEKSVPHFKAGKEFRQRVNPQ